MADELVTKTDLKTELAALEEAILERVERVETTLLREFRKWSMRIEASLKVDHIEIAALKERLAFLEERFDGFEGKQ
jgi:hypothetical protein